MTGATPLRPLRVLVAEDEFFIAAELAEYLQSMGADVLAVQGTLGDVRAALASAVRIDVAVLDINLRGELIYPVVDDLIARGIAVVFTTGYDASVIPLRYADIERCENPVCETQLVDAIHRAIARPAVA